ncbi:Alpha/Beta hydrolase protein [Mycena galericulata]|nr:Alpha/Beta hydrolase protein [Mycena galericulata]
MSDLFRSAMSARLAKLPLELPPHPGHDDDDGDSFGFENEMEEEMENETESSDSLGVLPGGGLGPPAMPFLTPRPKASRPPNPDFAPISAAGYFTDALQVVVPSRALDVRVYYTAPRWADGGGARNGSTVMVCHHGAGYSGLSFACLAKEIQGLGRGECGVLAADARRHGKTRSTASADKEDEDLSIGVLVDDFVATLRAVFPDPAVAPALLLVGHSMGGAVVARACPLLLEAKFRVSGIAVLDVVEGSALDALPHMHSLLNARPDGFDSVEAGIQWHVKTKTIRSTTSARVSVPTTLVPTSPSASSSSPSPTPTPSGTTPSSTGLRTRTLIGTGTTKQHPHAYTWRTPLRSTAPYWSGWFTGLSSAFLDARAARLLLLAGTDRLDRPLMIAQMQGKFQLEVINGVGHMLHEDDPTTVASILIDFWRRNDRIRLPTKIKGVGDA